MTPDPDTRCPVCGVRYSSWRSPWSGNPRGALAVSNASKARAWAEHTARCDDYPADAVAFDPAALSSDPSGVRTVFLPVEGPEPADPFDPDPDPVAICANVAWEARERLAREILGPDYQRVQEAA